MSTFIEVRRVVHASEKTTAIRLDDDLKVTVRTEKAGTETDHQVNFTGIKEGVQIATTDPYHYVQLAKQGTDEVATIGVNVYYAEGDESTVPENGTYYYNPSTHYAFGGTAEQGKSEAPDPSFEGTSQTFPQLIFNISTLGALPTGNTVAAVTIQSEYSRLGNTATRRSYLKGLILENTIEHPNYPQWLAGNFLTPLTSASNLGALVNYQRSLQALSYYPEMLTRAVSIDGNLTGSNAERKFNLLEGMAKLNLGVIYEKNDVADLANEIATTDGSGDLVRRSSTRDDWHFMRLGTIAPGNSGAYSAPGSWNPAPESIITMTGSIAVIGADHNWQDWLRQR